MGCKGRRNGDDDGDRRLIRRHYVDVPQGQLHLRENGAVGGVPLVCLHATAYSSRTFGALLAALDRPGIAVDTPGYGESDALSGQPAIADYAAGMIEGLPKRFDLLGYHTGVAIAAEIALRWPERVGKLTLMGVPHFKALDFAHWRERLASKHVLGDDLAQFEERWRFLVETRPEGLTLRRGFENFIDELKAWPDGWRSHAALFEWDLPARFALIEQPVTILNPPGHLAEPSRQAASFIAKATLIELPGLTGAFLEIHAAKLAELLT